MILFDNWQISINGLVARQYDNLSRRIDVEGDLPEGYTWQLLVQSGSNADTILLQPTEKGVGAVLTADNLSKAWDYLFQLRGVLEADGVTKRHTNVVSAYIPESLTGLGTWPEVPAEFAQVEARILELYQHPPIPGSNGFWLVWDADADEYVESQLALPDISVGPQGPKGDPGETYTLPIASSTQLGGVQPAAKTDAMTQTVGVDEAGALWTAPGSGGGGSSNWELLYSATLEEDITSFLVTEDANGESFEANEVLLYLLMQTTDKANYFRFGFNGYYIGEALQKEVEFAVSNAGNASGVYELIAHYAMVDENHVTLISGMTRTSVYNAFSGIRNYGDIAPKTLEAGKITSICATNGVTLPAGTIMQLYIRR